MAKNRLDEKAVVVINSGYFNPIHRGHVECINLSKKLFPKVHMVVIVNNDEQFFLKKGYTFVPIQDRADIVKNIKSVDEVFVCIDKDRSVIKSLEVIAKKYKGHKIVFAKGGDRNAGNIPENEVCKKYNIEIIDGIGAKIQNSSDIMKYLDDYIKNKSHEEINKKVALMHKVYWKSKKLEIGISISLLILFLIIIILNL